MKRLFLTLIAGLLILSSCSKTEQFKVTLNLSDADSQTAYLFKNVDNNEILIDSAVVTDKKAEFLVDCGDLLTVYTIKFNKNEKCEVFSFFTENQNTTITGGNIGDRQYWKVDGCLSMDAYNDYREYLLPMEEKMMALYNESQECILAGDTAKAQALFEKTYELMDEYTKNEIEYIKNLPDTYFAHYLIDLQKETMDINALKDVFRGFETESVFSKSIKDYIEKYENGEIKAFRTCVTIDEADK